MSEPTSLGRSGDWAWFRLTDECLAALDGHRIVARAHGRSTEIGTVAEVTPHGFALRTKTHLSWYGRNNAMVEVRDA